MFGMFFGAASVGWFSLSVSGHTPAVLYLHCDHEYNIRYPIAVDINSS